MSSTDKVAARGKHLHSTTKGGSRILTRSYARVLIDGLLKDNAKAGTNVDDGLKATVANAMVDQNRTPVLNNKSSKEGKKEVKNKTKKKQNLQPQVTNQQYQATLKTSWKGRMRRQSFWIPINHAWKYLKRLMIL